MAKMAWGNRSTSFQDQLQEIRDYVGSNEGEEGDRLRNGMQRLGVLFQTYGIGENSSSQVSARQSAEARIYISELQRRLSQIERQDTERRQTQNRDTLWETKYRPIANNQDTDNAPLIIRALYQHDMRSSPEIYGPVDEPEILNPRTAVLAANIRRTFDGLQNEMSNAEPRNMKRINRRHNRKIRTVLAAAGAGRMTTTDRVLNFLDWLYEDAWFK